MPSPPYDSVEQVLQLARSRLNDAIVSINGDILTDTAGFTATVINGAWRRLQEFLADRGYSRFNSEIIFTNVPAWNSASSDPGVFVSMNWAQFFDGSGNWPGPVLPQDAIMPLDLWERVNGSGTQFWDMDQCFGGLPTANPGTGPGARSPLNKLWEWRNDSIFMPGAIGATDLRIRYASYAADFAYGVGAPAWGMPVPIMRCLNSFAWYVCFEMADPRGDLNAAGFELKAQDAAEQVWNRDYRPGKRLEQRAELGKVPDPQTLLHGANAPNTSTPLAVPGGNQ